MCIRDSSIRACVNFHLSSIDSFLLDSSLSVVDSHGNTVNFHLAFLEEEIPNISTHFSPKKMELKKSGQLGILIGNSLAK